MRFGIFGGPSRTTGDDARAYGEFIDMTVEAEQLGSHCPNEEDRACHHDELAGCGIVERGADCVFGTSMRATRVRGGE